MKRNLVVAAVLGLLASGTGAAALQCTVPANLNAGPFLPFTDLLQCSNGAGVNGLGQGALASGSLPKRICADLRAGVDADARGFDGEFGNLETSCRKHDSTANGVNICTTGATACANSTHQGLLVRN